MSFIGRVRRRNDRADPSAPTPLLLMQKKDTISLLISRHHRSDALVIPCGLEKEGGGVGHLDRVGVERQKKIMRKC